ncbi:MAG TPA: hypothetical protein VFB00_03540 [Terriglobales bacterium]|nr:hypothetical protein [Terriglobales bacterium]
MQWHYGFRAHAPIRAGESTTPPPATTSSQIRDQRGHVAAAAAYIENAHTGGNAGFGEKLQGKRRKRGSLPAQPLQFLR